MSKYYPVDVKVRAICKSCKCNLEIDVGYSRGEARVIVNKCNCSPPEINTSGKFWNSVLDEFEIRNGTDFRRELELFAFSYLVTPGED